MKFSFIFLLIICFSMSAFSSERVQDLIARDARESLDLIAEKKALLEEYQEQLSEIDFHLKETNKGQMTYLHFDRIAGSVIVVGIMIGSYKTKFPPGLRAMIAAYTTVTGLSRGLIKLTPLQLKLFMSHVKLLNGKIEAANSKLGKEALHYCKNYPDHTLCSN